MAKYKIDESAYEDEQATLENESRIRGGLWAASHREAPTAEQTQLGQSQTTEANTVANAPLAQTAQLGPAQRFQGAQLDTGQSDQVRAGQQGVIQQLTDRASGKAPSAAELTLRASQDKNLKNQLALAASQPGVNPALAQRSLGRNLAESNQESGLQAAALRAQEQASAQDQLSNALNQTRGQDLSLAQNQAQLAQQTGMFNAEQGNQFALTQGQFNQQSGLANQQAQLNVSLANQDAQNRANMFNAEQGNQFALTQGQMNQNLSLANQQATLQNQAQVDNLTQFYVSQGMNIDAANRAAKIQLAQQQQELAQFREGIKAQKSLQEDTQNQQDKEFWRGAALNVAGQALGAGAKAFAGGG